ncbi:ATP-dependent helicase HrpB [Psychromonas sp. MME2]|uniref:ATP-dependent helicase HrpB n=1 Tax=Psychromonas sp. MME2 TaxID=3231033 RepID=UPI00339BF656
MQKDPELSGVGLIIFDEFHERSIHADLALMLALEVQQAYRDDLKLLVMSATIDADLLANYLNNAPIISCPGRTYPVAIDYINNPTTYLEQQVMQALRVVLNEINMGDILVFLPGQGEIKRLLKLAKEQLDSNIEFLPLYGALPLAQQELVLSKTVEHQRRVIFSTNIAETSLTITGITCVIDSGLEKQLNFDVKSGLSRLDTTHISKASATQRAGRAGRLQNGRCIRLWSEAKQHGLHEFQAEEITNKDLSSLVLELSAWGVTQFDMVNWLTPPPEHHFDVACTLNRSLSLMADHNKLTQQGELALTMGLEPRLASMLLHCDSASQQHVASVLAALLSERDILFNADSADIMERVILFNDYLKDRRIAKQNQRINIHVLDQVITLARSFAKSLRIAMLHDPMSLPELNAQVGTLLLRAYPDRLAKIRNVNSNRYLLANGRGVTLREGDALQGSQWLVVCDCDGKNKDGYIYSAATVSMAQINSVLASSFKTNHHYLLDDKKEKVIGREQLLYHSLLLQEKIVNTIPENDFVKCVADIVKQEGLGFLNWTKKCAGWLARAEWLGGVMDSFPPINERYLMNELENWFLPYISHIKTIKQLRQYHLIDLLMATLTWQEREMLESHAPESLFIKPLVENRLPFATILIKGRQYQLCYRRCLVSCLHLN